MNLLRPVLWVFLCLFLAYPTFAQNSEPIRSSNVLKNADVIQLLNAGISAEIVVAQIKASVCDFNTSTTELIELKSLDVPDAVILAMVQAPRPDHGANNAPVAQQIQQGSEQPSGARQDGLSCDKVVSFALADPNGVHPFMGTGNWIGNWVRKNGQKYPDICFSQTPMQGRENYLLTLSQSAGYLTGFDPVVRTNTSTSTSPVSGSGTATDNYGGMWNYTYNGTVTTTTTTTTNENVPYTINSNTLFANAYDERGNLVSRRFHVYSTKSGGDSADSLGYNLGNALAAINARGRLIDSVVKDIEGKK